MAWRKQYVHWTRGDWKNAIFSDEPSFFCVKTEESMQNLAIRKRSCCKNVYSKQIPVMVAKLVFGVEFQAWIQQTQRFIPEI